MSMGLVVLIVWLLNITENHSVNTHQTQAVWDQIVYAETKNSGLRRSVSRCNRSVDQPGLEIC